MFAFIFHSIFLVFCFCFVLFWIGVLILDVDWDLYHSRWCSYLWYLSGLRYIILNLLSGILFWYFGGFCGYQRLGCMYWWILFLLFFLFVFFFTSVTFCVLRLISSIVCNDNSELLIMPLLEFSVSCKFWLLYYWIVSILVALLLVYLLFQLILHCCLVFFLSLFLSGYFWRVLFFYLEGDIFVAGFSSTGSITMYVGTFVLSYFILISEPKIWLFKMIFFYETYCCTYFCVLFFLSHSSHPPWSLI